MLPNFLIVGARKSGTTGLWRALRAHPEVCMPAIKEPGFFTRAPLPDPHARPDESRFHGTYDRGLAWYESLFAACGRAKAVGEASNVYLWAEDAPELIRETLPKARLIFLFRDPVERLYSDYWYQRMRGWQLPDFAELVASEHPQFAFYREASHYRPQVERYLERFPREQLCFLTFDALTRATATTLSKVYRFLGVDPDFVPADPGRRVNPTGVSRAPAVPRLISQARTWPVTRTLPERPRRALGRLALRAERLFQRERDYPPLAPELRRRLCALFADDVAFVAALTGEDLAAWRADGRGQTPSG